MGYNMIYYIFDTEQEALSAESTIVNNIKSWVQQYSPDAITGDQQKLKGRNAKTGELTNVYTTRWAVPVERLDGKWVFQKPIESDTTPIPLSQVILNIAATEEEYSDIWFPEPEAL